MCDMAQSWARAQDELARGELAPRLAFLGA